MSNIDEIDKKKSEMNSFSSGRCDDSREISVVGGVLYGAGTTGKKHRQRGEERQDFFEIRSAGDFFIIAVSDGAGSKNFSAAGARVACEGAADRIEEGLLRLTDKTRESLKKKMRDKEFLTACGHLAELLREGVHKAYEALCRERDRLADIYTSVFLSDLSTTCMLLIGAVLEADDGQELFTVSLSIGDGCIALVNENAPFEKAVKVIGGQDSGRYAGETEFLQSEGMLEERNLKNRTYVSRQKISMLFVMTDGVGDDYYPLALHMRRLCMDLRDSGILDAESEKDSGTFRGYGGGIQKSDRLLQWLGEYEKRGSFDDRTLVIFQPSDVGC